MEKIRTEFTGRTETEVHAPLVTIVILNHNYGEFVDRCIQSVDQQDYPNIQCLVLECASNDRSLSVIEEALGNARRPFFELLRRDTNLGQVMNNLSALNDIRGVFVTFVDADDFLFPQFVSTHVRAHLNDVNSAALSITDQIQVDADGQVLASTCHWHQKWRAFESGTAWMDLTHARSWTAGPPHSMEPIDISRLCYIPAWWSSWVRERWIWSATSGIMFRKSVIESLGPPMEMSADLGDLSMDSYFARFAHSVGGTLVIDSAQGGYRRHGRNKYSANQILGGQSPAGSRDEIGRFHNCQRVARHVLVTRHRELLKLLGGDLYYSIAWQLMSNQDFLDFAKNNEEDRVIWEKTIRIAGAAHPSEARPSTYRARADLSSFLPAGHLSSLYAGLKSGFEEIVRRAAPALAGPEPEALAKSLYASLSDGQRNEICFEWNHHDPERGVLRRFIANHWQVTRPVIASDFFTPAQQALIGRIFRSLLDPAWRRSFIRQLADDTDGHMWGKDQSVAFFGDPRSEPWQFVLTGRHLTLRVGSRQNQVFGGPIFYGHAASGYREQAGHPGNIFWPQAKAASNLYAMLDGTQRRMAEVEALPPEPAIKFETAPTGLPARLLSPAQLGQLNLVLKRLAAPFRASDRAHIAACLSRQGGPEALNLSFARANRISAPDWDDWRLQGPSFLWHWRGWPHVHVWVNVGDDPAEPVNARSGAFIFPEHDPLQF